jgi:hypothetical protein
MNEHTFFYYSFFVGMNNETHNGTIFCTRMYTFEQPKFPWWGMHPPLCELPRMHPLLGKHIQKAFVQSIAILKSYGRASQSITLNLCTYYLHYNYRIYKYTLTCLLARQGWLLQLRSKSPTNLWSKRAELLSAHAKFFCWRWMCFHHPEELSTAYIPPSPLNLWSSKL